MGLVKHIFATAVAFVLTLGVVQAQEVLLPLQSIPTTQIHTKSTSSVELPFFDDFSKCTNALDPNLWDVCGATAGLGYGELPPTIGMVTLDAISPGNHLTIPC